LHLLILGILVTWFKLSSEQRPQLSWLHRPAIHRLMQRWLAPLDTPSAPSQTRQRIALLGIVVLLYAAIVPSHQLTPFITLASVGGLVVFRRCSPRGLPLLMGVMLGLWVGYMTTAYLNNHIEHLLSAIGQVSTTMSTNVAERLGGSPEHLFVNYVRLAMTVAIWGLAFIGGIRRLRAGHWDLTYALLAVTPFLMLVLQSYGGEMILRVYLFALPFMVLFAAALFFPTLQVQLTPRSVLLIGVVSLGLLAGFLFSRYGNERMDYVTPQEEAVVQRLYEVAPPGTLLAAASPDLPWKFRDYEKYRYTVVTAEVLTGNPGGIATALREGMRGDMNHAYLVLTRGQAAHLGMFYALSDDAWAALQTKLRASPLFHEVFANEGGVIFELATDGEVIKK
jgi:hypothetical protein